MIENQNQEWTIDSSPADVGAISYPVEGSRYFAGGAAEWQESEAKGFWVKLLFQNQATGSKTMLMKVDAGAWSPMHHHPGELEQIYVLSGSFYDQNTTLLPGDFCCRAPNSNHEAGSIDGAIVMLVYNRA